MTQKLTILNWHPCRDNQLIGCHWRKKARLRKFDDAVVSIESRCQEVSKATVKRRVWFVFVMGYRQRTPDPTAYNKSLLDALVNAKLLIDDSGKWCELMPVEFRRCKQKKTIITLEDL